MAVLFLGSTCLRATAAHSPAIQREIAFTRRSLNYCAAAGTAGIGSPEDTCFLIFFLIIAVALVPPASAMLQERRAPPTGVSIQSVCLIFSWYMSAIRELLKTNVSFGLECRHDYG